MHPSVLITIVIKDELRLLLLSFLGDTSKSARVSKIVWIVPVITAAVVTVLVILIFAIHKKFRGTDLEHNQEVSIHRFYSNLTGLEVPKIVETTSGLNIS